MRRQAFGLVLLVTIALLVMSVPTARGGLDAMRPLSSAGDSLIAFSARDWNNGDNYEVGVVNADGTGLRNLSNNPDTDESSTVWSPTGSEIAFTRWSCLYAPPPCDLGIRVVGLDGTGERQLTTGELDWPAAWSPDGQRIIFTRLGGLYAVNADGSEERRLARGGDEAAFSPDGAWIAYSRAHSVYVMHADGTSQRRLAGGDCHLEGCSPSWAPDGRKLAFAGPNGIYRVNVDGSGLRLLRRGGYRPAWSPAGWKIAFGSGDGGLYLINANGSGERRLVRRGQAPAWSPDGQRIAFSVDFGRYGIWVMNSDGSKRKRLVALVAGGPVWSPISG